MTKKHSVLDHPIIGYFVLLIFVLAFSSIGASLRHMRPVSEPLLVLF